MTELRASLAAVLLITALSCAAGAPDPADTLYRSCRDSLYQIRVIEVTSGKKASIGTGFGVSTNGLLATNYHVVQDVIAHPKLYRLECAGADGKPVPGKIMDVDVVHDLAVVLREDRPVACLTLSRTPIKTGASVFSFGDPLDLGMAIVTGTYNGIMEKRFHEQALFSGSLNPGMSGGPAVDRDGQVVGVNVTTMGQQIGFLVPVKYLAALLDRVDGAGLDASVDLHERIEQQLFDDQDQFMTRLMNTEWVHDPVGAVRVPRISTDILDWWAHADSDTEALYEHTVANCASRERTWLSSSFETGLFTYRCDWYASKGLIPLRFYSLLAWVFNATVGLNAARKDDVTNFETQSSFVNMAGRDWLVVFSTRNYKRYPRLYDIVVKMASVSELDRALLVDLELSGVSEDAGLAFVRKFMEEMQWPK